MMEHRDDNSWNDDALRRMLEGPLEGDTSWAEPTDRVWEGVSRSIGKRERKRRALWWWFGGLAALLTVGVYTLVDRAGMDQGAIPPGISAKPADTNREPSAAEQRRSEGILQEISGQDTASPSKGKASSPSQSGLEPASGSLRRGDIAGGIGSRGAKGIDAAGTGMTPAVELPLVLAEATAADPVEQVVQNAAPPTEGIAPREGLGSLQSLEGTVPELPQGMVLPALSEVVGTHRLTIYGHGTGADMDWQRRRPNFPGPPIFPDDPISQRYEGLRLGLGWEWQHRSGWFLSSGLEYQAVREETERALPWRFTRMGGMPGPGGFSQDLALSLSGGFGNNSADLRVSVRELQNTQDYQEGDSVRLSLTMRHQLRQVRVPVMAGYRLSHHRFFAEIKAGVGLQVNTGFDAELTKLTDERNRLRLQGPVRLKRSPQLSAAFVDVQVGAAVGLRLFQGLEWSVGWDGWRGIGPAVRLAHGQGFLTGTGITTGIRWQLPDR